MVLTSLFWSGLLFVGCVSEEIGVMMFRNIFYGTLDWFILFLNLC